MPSAVAIAVAMTPTMSVWTKATRVGASVTRERYGAKVTVDVAPRWKERQTSR